MSSLLTNPEEFKKFHELLMKDAPRFYYPFYFVLEKNGKDPLKGESWKNSPRTVEEAYKFMQDGFNIGIAATDKDSLVIVDIDDINQVKDPKPTLMNNSRKRIGRHCFYFTGDVLARNIFDDSAKQNIATEDAGEVRSNWQYVVAAGSYVPCNQEELERIPERDRHNAGKYTLMLEQPVSKISYEELPEVYRLCIDDKRAAAIAKQKKNYRPRSFEKETKFRSALWSLTIQDVTGRKDDQSYRFPSPFHDSNTSKDTCVSYGMMHCWRHLCSHTALTYLAVEAGLSDCSHAGYGHKSSGDSNIDFADPETIYKLWDYAKKHGYIPENDPIPRKALQYYAIQHRLCTEKHIDDEGKIPLLIYNVALLIAAEEGINLGRS